MASKQSHFELKVGIFAFIGLLVLFMIVFSIGDFYLFNPGYTLTVRFGTASGMQVGAPVHVAGVVSGEVREIQIHFDKGNTLVDLLVWLKKGTMVPDNSSAEIRTLGLLGEKYLDILPGQNAEKFLQEGSLLVGQNPVSMDSLIARGNALATELEASAKSLRAILQKVESGEGTVGKLMMDDTLYREIEGLVSDLKAHPWKLLKKEKESTPDREKGRR